MRFSENNIPYATLDSFSVATSSPTPFVGATSNARGDKDGTSVSFKIFDVVGDVLVRLYGVCSTTLVGAGTLEVGVLGNTAVLLAQVADATTIATGDLWIDSSPAEVRAALLSNVPATTLLVSEAAGSANILEKCGTADITAGQIRYVCFWQAVTGGSSVKGTY